MERVEAVRKFRLASKSAPTRKIAERPTRFHVENMPKANYLVVPKVSSERRIYIPVGFMPVAMICSDLLQLIPDAHLDHFGILSSAMHMAWVRYVAGRLKSDFRYSNQIVYNNFPWPQDVSEKQKAAVEKSAQGVLDARKQFLNASLADLYDPVAMPPALRAAHTALDRAVDAAYGKKSFNSDAERVAFLFDLYQKYTTLLPAAEKPKRARKRKTP